MIRTGQSSLNLQLLALSTALRKRAISRVFLASSFLVSPSSFFVSLNSSFRGFTIFSIKIRVACSALSIRTLSASALAFSASALARSASAFDFNTVAFRVTTPMTDANSPPPSIQFSITLNSIASRLLVNDYSPESFPANRPIIHCTKPVSAIPFATRVAPKP